MDLINMKLCSSNLMLEHCLVTVLASPSHDNAGARKVDIWVWFQREKNTSWLWTTEMQTARHSEFSIFSRNQLLWYRSPVQSWPEPGQFWLFSIENLPLTVNNFWVDNGVFWHQMCHGRHPGEECLSGDKIHNWWLSGLNERHREAAATNWDQSYLAWGGRTPPVNKYNKSHWNWFVPDSQGL